MKQNFLRYLPQYIMASSRRRQASSNWPSSAWAFAKHAKRKGNDHVEPVARNVAMAEVSV